MGEHAGASLSSKRLRKILLGLALSVFIASFPVVVHQSLRPVDCVEGGGGEVYFLLGVRLEGGEGHERRGVEDAVEALLDTVVDSLLHLLRGILDRFYDLDVLP